MHIALDSIWWTRPAMFDRIRFRLRALFQPSAFEREMHDEMQAHLDRRIEVLVASGMNPESARLAARREFGNVGLHQEHARDARRMYWIDSVRTDVRFALRSFARKPFLSVTIVLVLALGIGAHAFELTLLQSITRRTAPGVPTDLELVRLRGMWRAKDQTGWSPLGFSYPELREMTALPNTFSSVAAWTTSDVVVDARGSLDRASASSHFVTDGYFGVLGLQPARGPGLPRGTTEPQFVAVISHAMWEDAFGSAEDVATRTLVVNGVAVRIVGVAPAHFAGPIGGAPRHALWMPLSARTAIMGAGRANSASMLALSSVDSTLFNAVGALQQGVTPEQATARVRVVANRTVARMTWPATPVAVGNVYDADVVPLRGTTDVTPSDMPEISAILGIITTLVLLIACTNVSGLVVSAGAARRQEIAIRLSLGASRRRVIRQLLTESALLAAVGGAVGLLLYWWIIGAIAKREPDAAWLTPDYAIVAATMFIALATGVLCGLTPALQATRQDVSETLKGDSTGSTPRSRLQRVFVVAQVVFTQPLLVVFGGLVGTLLLNGPPTLPSETSERVLRIAIGRVPGSAEERSAALQRVERRISELPGVVQVMGDADPLRRATVSVHPDDRGTLPRAGMATEVDMQLVRPGYFSMLDAPLVRGNDAPPPDTSGIITISSDLARDLWGSADPIGRRLVQSSKGIGVNRVFTVTGVYDTRYLSKGSERPRVYRPTAAWWPDRYLIRTVGQASELNVAIRRVVREELPVTPIFDMVTLAQAEASAAKEGRLIKAGVTAAGGLVLVLASLGLYGVVALAVAQRRREIGVRMAIGARADQVVRFFYLKGIRLGVLGLLIGLPVSLAVQKVIDNLVDNPTQLKPSVFLVGGVVAAVVLVVSSIATLLPATRAAKVDPVTALRSE